MTQPTPDTALLVMLARVEGKIDGIAATLARHDLDLDDHETRIRVLEASRWKWAGAAAAIGAASGVIGSLFPLVSR